MKGETMKRTDPTFSITVIAFKGKKDAERVYKKFFIGRGSIKTLGLNLFGIPDTLDYDRLAVHIGDEQTPVRATETAAQRLAKLYDCSEVKPSMHAEEPDFWRFK